MCMIKVRPEIEIEERVPPRIYHEPHRGISRGGSHRSRSSVRGEHETTTYIETIKPPPPPPSALSLGETHEEHTIIINHAHPSSAPPINSIDSRHGSHGHWDHGSPRTSVVSTPSRDVDYHVDSCVPYASRSPRGSYRYVDGTGPRGSAQRIMEGIRSDRKELEYPGSQRSGERYGYNNFHGRRSGSVHYVNPRHSAVSQRSARSGREKVVVMEESGRTTYY